MGEAQREGTKGGEGAWEGREGRAMCWKRWKDACHACWQLSRAYL